MLKVLLLLAFLALTNASSCPNPNALDHVDIKVNYTQRATNRIELFTNKSLNSLIPDLNKEDGVDVSFHNFSGTILCTGGIQDLPTVTRLGLLGLEIEDIQDNAIQNLPKLTDLGMARNKLTIIKSNYFNHLETLEFFNLGHNQIEQIEPGAFKTLIHLKTLLLDHNKLQEINPFWMINNPKIQTIDLEYNELKTLEFGNFVLRKSNEVIKINLGHNRLTDVASSFIVEFDSVKEIAKDLIEPKVLESSSDSSDQKLKINIEMNFNKIKELPFDFVESFHKFEGTVGLDFNDITCISDSNLDDLLTSKVVFKIHSNVWNCTCYHKVATYDNGKTPASVYFYNVCS